MEVPRSTSGRSFGSYGAATGWACPDSVPFLPPPTVTHQRACPFAFLGCFNSPHFHAVCPSLPPPSMTASGFQLLLLKPTCLEGPFGNANLKRSLTLFLGGSPLPVEWALKKGHRPSPSWAPSTCQISFLCPDTFLLKLQKRLIPVGDQGTMEFNLSDGKLFLLATVRQNCIVGHHWCLPPGSPPGSHNENQERLHLALAGGRESDCFQIARLSRALSHLGGRHFSHSSPSDPCVT